MKTFLSIIALCSVVAAPAFAQAPRSHADTQWSSRVHVYSANHYAPRGTNANSPDFQLGGAHGN